MTSLILALVLALVIYPQALSDPSPLPEPIPVIAPKEEVKPQPIRTIICEATAYCEQGTTATGTQAGPGSIAVDPTIIPLGSHLYVEGYGEGWAVDTGSAIRGYIIDVWLPDPQTCREWGRKKNVEVQILEVPE